MKMVAVILFCSTIFASSAFANYEPEDCGSDYERFFIGTLNRASWIEPKELLEFKIKAEKTDVSGAPYNTVALYGRTIPAAYLVNWDPMSGEEPNKYVTPEARAVLQKTAYQKITWMLCPQAPNSWNRKEFFRTMSEFGLWWGVSQDSKFMRAFQDAFDKRFAVLWDPFMKKHGEEKGLWPYPLVRSLDTYLDLSFSVLRISLYANIALWDGSGETYEPMLNALRDKKTYSHAYHVKIRVVDAGDNTNNKMIEALGIKYADKVFEDFKKEISK